MEEVVVEVVEEVVPVRVALAGDSMDISTSQRECEQQSECVHGFRCRQTELRVDSDDLNNSLSEARKEEDLFGQCASKRQDFKLALTRR